MISAVYRKHSVSPYLLYRFINFIREILQSDFTEIKQSYWRGKENQVLAFKNKPMGPVTKGVLMGTVPNEESRELWQQFYFFSCL